MASRAVKAITAEFSAAERLLWEKYNKPNRNLFQALSAFEAHGVGRKVMPFKWEEKGFKDCYYTVTDMKPRITLQGLHGRARGILTWRGQVMNEGQDRRIPNALKLKWKVLE